MKKRILCTLLAGMLGLFVLTGCKKQPERLEFTTLAMDTVMSFTLYSRDKQEAQSVQDHLTLWLRRMDSLLAASNETSDVNQINQAGGAPTEVEDHTAQLLAAALELCEATDGALDITAYPAVKAWGFTTGEHRVPGAAELEELAEAIDYRAVGLEESTVTLPAGMEIDLGGVAKGYTGDLLAANVRDNNIPSALLDLGQSTIVAVGAKPDGSPWRIAVQDPAGEGYFGVVELEDMAMGTSGGYQRYFEQDGVTYWHILDPATAAPARSGVISATVVAPSALTCDGLSTALFVMGLEKGAQFWREHPELEFEAIFVTEDGGIYHTAGLTDRFTLAEGYEDREVTVLE